jgi:alkylated DNA repair protein (DNA oxidative demethylase)
MSRARDTIVSGSIGLERQRVLVQEVREVLKVSPLVQPSTPNGLPMHVRVSAAGALGWVGDGAYHYSPTDSRGKPWPPIPESWLEIADLAAGIHPWDCAILNWYGPGASLGWHRDLSEADLSLPIVTISLGDACSWAVRLDEDSPISRTRLESGEITLLAGRNRMALHTVERLIDAPMFSPLASRGRVSITLRVAGPA